MKTFVFAYNRYHTMTTSKMLAAEGIEHYVMMHSEADREKFEAGGTIGATAHVVVTGNPKGLTRQRNSALDMLDEGEWAVFMNDDLKRITMLRQYETYKGNRIEITPANIRKVDQDFRTEITCRKLFELMETTIRESAEREGARLVGFVPHTNTQFRGSKVTRQGLVDGRLWLFKNERGTRFDERVNVLEDHDFTAYHLCRYGRVHVENWILPEFGRNTAGGFGTIQDRAPQLREEAAYLIEKWDGLFGYKEKKGYPPRTQLQFKRNGVL